MKKKSEIEFLKTANLKEMNSEKEFKTLIGAMNFILSSGDDKSRKMLNALMPTILENNHFKHFLKLQTAGMTTLDKEKVEQKERNISLFTQRFLQEQKEKLEKEQSKERIAILRNVTQLNFNQQAMLMLTNYFEQKLLKHENMHIRTFSKEIAQSQAQMIKEVNLSKSEQEVISAVLKNNFETATKVISHLEKDEMARITVQKNGDYQLPTSKTDSLLAQSRTLNEVAQLNVEALQETANQPPTKNQSLAIVTAKENKLATELNFIIQNGKSKGVDEALIAKSVAEEIKRAINEENLSQEQKVKFVESAVKKFKEGDTLLVANFLEKSNNFNVVIETLSQKEEKTIAALTNVIVANTLYKEHKAMNEVFVKPNENEFTLSQQMAFFKDNDKKNDEQVLNEQHFDYKF